MEIANLPVSNLSSSSCKGTASDNQRPHILTALEHGFARDGTHHYFDQTQDLWTNAWSLLTSTIHVVSVILDISSWVNEIRVDCFLAQVSSSVTDLV